MMSDGREYHQQMAQLQRALRERELHRLDLEKENLAKIQRREKRHEQLRSKIKALHKELVQEEIESTQKVTLLLSQVDSVRREYDLLEARTERLRQKKHQYEVFLGKTNPGILFYGTSGYDLHSIRSPGQDAIRLTPPSNTSHILRSSVSSSQQRYQHPYMPYSVPSTAQTAVPVQVASHIAQGFGDHATSMASLNTQPSVSTVRGSALKSRSHDVATSGMSFIPTLEHSERTADSSEYHKLHFRVPNGSNSVSLSGGQDPRLFGAGNTIDSAVSLDSCVAESRLSFRNVDLNQQVTERIPERQQVLKNPHSSIEVREIPSQDQIPPSEKLPPKHPPQPSTPSVYHPQPSVAPGHHTQSFIAPGYPTQPSIPPGHTQQSFISLEHHSQSFLPSGSSTQPSVSPQHPSQASILTGYPMQPSITPGHLPQPSIQTGHPPQPSTPPGHLPQPSISPGHPPQETIPLSPNSDQSLKLSEVASNADFQPKIFGPLHEDSGIEVTSVPAVERVMNAPVKSSNSRRESVAMMDSSFNENSIGSANGGYGQDPGHRASQEGGGGGRDNASELTPQCNEFISRQSDVPIDDEQRNEHLQVPQDSHCESQTLDVSIKDDESLPGEKSRKQSFSRKHSVSEQSLEDLNSRRPSLASAGKPESSLERVKEETPRHSLAEVKESTDLNDCDYDQTSNEKSDSNDTIASPSRPSQNPSQSFLSKPSKEVDEDNDSDFFDKEVAPLTASRAYKSLLGDMAEGGPAVTTESDSDDIEGQMSSLAVRETSVKRPAYRPFSSSIPSLQPAPPGTDSDSVDSVEAAIQAAMNKPKQGSEAPEKTTDEGQKMTTGPPGAPNSFQETEKQVPVKPGGRGNTKKKTKASAALSLKLESDSESYGVSGGDNESEDDFDFYD